ncbi:hypothetical protein HY643_00410 [Candidatus Woesearchaeota archaeon]|nr:hypothetical protein [Candidatus Woesearchaeota archaeon]
MKELFNSFPKKDYKEVRNMVLLDTCFLLNILDHKDKIAKMERIKNLAMTSFNVEEIIKIEHKIDHRLKNEIRKFLKKHDFLIVEIPVNVGNRQQEKDFVNSVDEKLLQKVADPSDAVLIAAAIKTHSTVLTRDKHHLFTVELENFLKAYDIQVYNHLAFL